MRFGQSSQLFDSLFALCSYGSAKTDIRTTLWLFWIHQAAWFIIKHHSASVAMIALIRQFITTSPEWFIPMSWVVSSLVVATGVLLIVTWCTRLEVQSVARRMSLWWTVPQVWCWAASMQLRSCTGTLPRFRWSFKLLNQKLSSAKTGLPWTSRSRHVIIKIVSAILASTQILPLNPILTLNLSF